MVHWFLVAEKAPPAPRTIIRICFQADSGDVVYEPRLFSSTHHLHSLALPTPPYPILFRESALKTLDDAFTNIPEPSSSASHCPEPASPATTEIAYDIIPVEQSAEEHVEGLQAAGIKVRDFVYEPMPKSSKAPEGFDPVPCLIAADWHMRNPEKNYGLLSPKGLFRLIKLGWLTLADVRMNFRPREYTALAQYNDRPDQAHCMAGPPLNVAHPWPWGRERAQRSTV